MAGDLKKIAEWGKASLYVGERYCRVSGCENSNCFSSTNTLRKHYGRDHPEITLETKAKGGRSTIAEISQAQLFYKDIMDTYDAIHASDDNRPPLPIKENGMVNMTQMKKMVRELGYSVPCEECRVRNNSKMCCHEDSKLTCEHFELFAKPRQQPTQQDDEA
ncbi:uncharacterized protein N7473_008570 [Penicillium subrubescens]|uniref:uncharacterized protein n=1 Tax=Penicillium subrubescens TaxID=1316194 RepID=UPI002544F053|nr:uncharacterized protein N7473_008570 [Penicillium subrubescens]KAJ5885896.1 hypothetical protein N7473_008570 [Penicillium subrubescens]